MGGDTMLGGILGLVILCILAATGIVWIFFPFIVNSRLKKIHAATLESTHETRTLIQETTKSNQLLTQLIAVNKQTSTQVTRKTSPVPIAQPPQTSQILTISKDGANIGDYTIANVKQMLRSGQLAYTDTFFDTKNQEWLTLDLNPSLY